MSFLWNVIQQKEREVAERRAITSLETLMQDTRASDVRDFREALAGGRRVIAELKKKSPAIASFRHSNATDGLARLYEKNGAAAISIVTDEANFGTSLRDVAPVRDEVTLPVLVKDFIVDEYQVYEARRAGADALLLISRILPPYCLAHLLETTTRLGMTGLVEVHSTEDVTKALEVGASVIGINNRDLDTLTIDLETTRRLAATIPKDKLVVAESGIKSRSEIDEFATLGIDAFLIGGALLEASDPGLLLRDLTGAAHKDGIGNDGA